MNNSMRVMIIGGFLAAIGGAIGYTAYSTIKRNEKEIAELPFAEEVQEEVLEDVEL